ncbi:hypothetical protein [Chelatococcus asaccharovorans]|uniref:hypothetical protein n=1 Tax=Chelatococcus asaccharovorans TaxID=28210 RepID=UPI00224C6625|nr:hypothetical protein [Chelatococcus asaccharovorans]CAH1649771.1 conserved hypothetical protein [Chelatococcus asaccharovorans]CAH1686902.1 conserved hypothetical protein [Chelatococcus asaccharovorans]
MATASEPGIVGLNTVIRLLGVTGERVRQLVRDGWIPKAGKDRYPLVGSVQGYVRFLQDGERRATKSAAAHSLADARRREIEVKIAREERGLIDIDEHVDVVDSLVEMFVDGLGGLPAAASSDDRMRERLDRSCADLAGKLRDRSAKRLGELQETGWSGAGEGE